jgi:long-chain acyl-CoA synthetase
MGITSDDLPLERIYRWERERADKPFLTQPLAGGEVRHWTWAQAIDESRRMAAFLMAQGWEPGSCVAILAKNCAWWIMADIAIWMAGYVSVPVYPSLRAQSIRRILRHSGARACFVGAVDEQDPALCRTPGTTWIGFPTAPQPADVSWETVIAAHAPLAGHPVRPGTDLATIIYTSGTTGSPKGVMHCFSAFASNAKALLSLLKLERPQRVFSYLPLAHIVERVAIEASGCRNGSHIFFTAGIETFIDDLQRARPTIFLSVPRLLLKFQQGVFARVPREKLERLLRIPAVNLFVKRLILRRLGLNTVHLAACGAAPLPAEILLWYRNLGLQLAEGYGMTETMITHIPEPGAVRPGYVGRAIDGVETRVGGEGELEVRSPMNMLGYYREPELTRNAFTPDGFFRTGDRVEIDAGGQLRIVGRLKEQFKTSKGKYVAPAPIESRLMEHPSVEACCLMGAGRPAPFAVVVLSDGVRERAADPEARRVIERSLLDHMRSINSELDPFERVSMIVIADGPWTVGNGLLTPTLKIRRGVIEQRYEAVIAGVLAQDVPVMWEQQWVQASPPVPGERSSPLQRP